jgi:CubicO group peptidase (beta-lactamase class C family)
MLQVVGEEVGFSSMRLRRITRFLRAAIERRELAGAVTLIARHGKMAHYEAVGVSNLAAGTPMTTDAIFHIASMTKPITAVATMLLFEEGHFLLDGPVAGFLPEFSATKVFVRETESGMDVAALEQPVTIRQLLLHPSGLTYDFDPSPVGKLYLQEQIGRSDEALAEKVRRLAGLPLAHQPGAGWTYGMSIDVLGRLVEGISGQPFDVFLKERIFDPLAMVDTGFYVPSAQLGRLATLYTVGATGDLQPDSQMESAYTAPSPLLSGGGGLFSTASDYARFCQMLLNGGELDGERVLGRATVALMLANHLPERLRPVPGVLNIPGVSQALGGGTIVDGALYGAPLSNGSYLWGGAFRTRFWIDRAEDLLGVFMVQLLPWSFRLGDLFQVLTYQALTA